MVGFSGGVCSEWLSDGRTMVLTCDLLFVDAAGLTWIAPAASVVDGASIPRIMWRVIGSPFVGKYRRASVIHDVYCVSKSRSYKSVHAVFLEMMKVDKVPAFKRRIMYWAVRYCGPKW